MKDSIHYRIRKLREKKDFSQENMAHELGISKSAYNKIETGVTNPNINRLMDIAKILDVDVIDFFKDTKEPSISEEQKLLYGFATKGDFEELIKMIKVLTEEINILKTSVKEITEEKPKTRKKK